MRSNVESGLWMTPRSAASAGRRANSSRLTVGSTMDVLLFLLDGVGEEHRVNALFQRLRLRGIAVFPRQAVELGLHLPRVRRQQQDATADLDRLGNRMRHEQHGKCVS